MTISRISRRMAVWTPALVETIFSILGVTIVSLVALGQWQLARQKTWRDAAEGKDSIIKTLLTRLDQAEKERDSLTIHIEAIRGEMALLQAHREEDRKHYDEAIDDLKRQNHRLQMQLDKAESRHTRDHGKD